MDTDKRSQIVVSHRAVYHMRQEISRLLSDFAPGRDVANEQGSATDSESCPSRTENSTDELKDLAGEWQNKYRTLRVETACLLVELLLEDRRTPEVLFGIFVIAAMKRRWVPELMSAAESWAPGLSGPVERTALAESVLAPLVRRFPELRDVPGAWATSNEPSLRELGAEAKRAISN